MARLQWDQIEDRNYEDGLDRGVLYPRNGTGVTWNGLDKVDEKHANGGLAPRYYEGEKFDMESDPSEFSARVTAYTYPDIIDSLTGNYIDKFGIMYDGAVPSEFFSLTYRTMVNGAGDYKLHALFNLKATSVDVTRNTSKHTPAPVLFSWDVEGVPERIMGMVVTRVIFDTRTTDLGLLKTLEDTLYGTDDHNGSFTEFLEYLG